MPQVIPFGDRILVKRKKVGKKIGGSGIILAADETADRPTDLATVVHIPDNSFADVTLLQKAESIVESQAKKAEEGDPHALLALLQFRKYLDLKTLRVDDEVMISKYAGITFHDNVGGDEMTLVEGEQVIGRVNYD